MAGPRAVSSRAGAISVLSVTHPTPAHPSSSTDAADTYRRATLPAMLEPARLHRIRTASGVQPSRVGRLLERQPLASVAVRRRALGERLGDPRVDKLLERRHELGASTASSLARSSRRGRPDGHAPPPSARRTSAVPYAAPARSRPSSHAAGRQSGTTANRASCSTLTTRRAPLRRPAGTPAAAGEDRARQPGARASSASPRASACSSALADSTAASNSSESTGSSSSATIRPIRPVRINGPPPADEHAAAQPSTAHAPHTPRGSAAGIARPGAVASRRTAAGPRAACRTPSTSAVRPAAERPSSPPHAPAPPRDSPGRRRGLLPIAPETNRLPPGRLARITRELSEHERPAATQAGLHVLIGRRLVEVPTFRHDPNPIATLLPRRGRSLTRGSPGVAPA